MEKIINVGGRLHNPVVGGALTGANEIKDDTKGKMQNVINQETDAELLRLDGAKQEKLTFDQTPTENSTNPVTSGGVYAADATLQQAIEAILLLIPSAASALNQLADKAFVNSSIATATATFRGTYNLVTDLELTVSATHQQIAAALASVVSTADNNDYCFVQIPVSDQSSDIRVTERYKFDGTSWEYEYDLNNSGFTADQWGAINSGITSVLVGKLGGLPTAQELAAMFAGKQNTLTFDTTPTSGSNNPVTSGGLYAKFATIDAMIPTGADANNKLVAENRLVAYVTTLINALDATFDVTSADGHVTLRMTQTDGVITSVQILTSDIASLSELTTLGGRVSTAESDIDALQDAYAALTQSDVVIVNGTLPSSGQQQNIIYRQPDQDHTPPQFYSDYMWNGTTWVLMATYNNAIDPRPKKGSQNLVTSGGVFDNMGALDVSELNATENPHTLATYADLSAALAAIPSDYQKGGMSIKFVLTSDNKYVQCRLMANSFTTDVTQWQNIDKATEALSNFVGYTNKIYSDIQSSGSWGNAYRYVPISNIFTEDDVNYVIEIQVLGGTVSSDFTVRVTEAGSSSSSHTVLLGTITADDITNHTKKRFTFKKLPEVAINYLRVGSMTDKSIEFNYILDSGVNAEVDTLKQRFDNKEWMTDVDNIYIISGDKECSHLQELFGVTDYTKVGDIIYYDVESVSGGVAAIRLLDTNGDLIDAYGIKSSSSSIQHDSGSFVIPEGFVKADIYANTGKTATVHYLKSQKNIVTIREDLDNVILDNQNLLRHIGYDNKISDFTVAYGGYVYIPISGIFTEKGINYVVELQFLSNISIDSIATIKLTNVQSSGDSDTIHLGYISGNEITNHVKKTFTFEKGDFDINYIRINNSGFTSDSSLKINYILDSGTNAILNTTKEKFDNEEWNSKVVLDNRLANPIYTSREKYNSDNPDSPIVSQTVFDNTGGSQSRIPISIITNSGTELLAATFSASGPVEYGKTSIDVARKNPTTGNWDKTRVFDYRVYGQFWNESFVVDRTGVHGVAGRIFLFSTCGLSAETETFDPDNYTPVPAADVPYNKVDLLYSYSDDDGVTWSTPASLKSLWTADEYTFVSPAPNTGIQLKDGTLVIPMVNAKDNVRYSCILYKKTNGSWILSSSVPTTYDQGNECVAVEVEDNVPTLYVRNEKISYYTVDNPDYIYGSGDQIWKYSFTGDTWEKINSTFNPVRSCQFSIIKCTIDSETFYLRSAIDTYNNNRINITIWVSLDCKKWLRVYRVYSPDGNGYSSVYEYNGKLIVSYEKSQTVDYQNITNIIPIIQNSLKYLNSNITIQDRMQMLFNKLDGID